ncbi:daunorubicin ABC transporter ATP-binding protein [Bacillus anthracis]|nr:daunorubicin ABC transporter ATP-binding protein [Bacillus anthracis]
MRNAFRGGLIYFSYNKMQPILNGLSLSIEDKQIYGLLGKSGSGKSTLVRVMLGLEKAEGGKLQWFNEIPNPSTKRRIGYVPQNLAFMYDLSVYENVLSFGKLYGLKEQNLKKQVKYALGLFELWDERNERSGDLSIDMKQRLNIACGIVHNPDVVILDEPTFGLDPQASKYILNRIVELNKTRITIVYISSNTEEVKKICSHVGIIHNGKLVCEGRLEDVIRKYADQPIIELELHENVKCYTEKLKDYKIAYAEEHCIGIEETDISLIHSIKERFGSEIQKIIYMPSDLEQVLHKLTERNLGN